MSHPQSGRPSSLSADPARSGRPPDFGIDAPRFLAALAPPSRIADSGEVHSGVVALMRRRGRTIRGAGTEHRDARANRATSLHVQRARTPEEFEAARELVRMRYAWRGYSTTEHDATATLPYKSAEEITFVATADNLTVGTITMGLDGPNGLLAENTHGETIRHMRSTCVKVCELTRLALAENVESKAVLAALISITYAACNIHSVTDVFIEVNPRHVAFYTRVLGFGVAGNAKLCERVQAPSVLLCLPIEHLDRRLQRLSAALLSRATRAA